MKDINIYLSSTTYHWWNFRSFLWKSKLIKKFLTFPISNKINFIDPLCYKSEDPSVCPRDIKDINKCDYIVCYIDKITIGTLLELGYCLFKNKKKKVFVLSFNKSVVNHPWIVYLCKNRIFNNYLNCCKEIYSDYISREEHNDKTTNNRTI